MPRRGRAGSEANVRADWLPFAWAGMAAILLVACACLTPFSRSFGSNSPIATMPILPFAATFMAVGAMFLSAIPLIARSAALQPGDSQRLLLAIFAFGLGLRLLLLLSEPVLEVDFNRYLWDGAITAHGYNPYALAPQQVDGLPYHDIRLELSKASGTVFEQISYPALRTIYPPVAQAAFALSYLLEPWSLTAWRCICIAADACTFALIIDLLVRVKRPPLMVILYWWNPLVIKEIANSAHMEAILLPLVLAALSYAVRRRPVSAALMLTLATGVKLWPVMLFPLVLRPLTAQPRMLLFVLMGITSMLAAFAAPIWMGGLDPASGFVSFARHWSTNSALFPVLERVVAAGFSALSIDGLAAGSFVRMVAAAVVLGVAIQLAIGPIGDANVQAGKWLLVISVLVLLSPAQFPWYVLWVLPFATLAPGIGWHTAAAIMPLYYTAFYFHDQSSYAAYETSIVWPLWIIIWAALAFDVVTCRRAIKNCR